MILASSEPDVGNGPLLPEAFNVKVSQYNPRAMPLLPELAKHMVNVVDACLVLHGAETVQFSRRLEWLLRPGIMAMHSRSGIIQ